MKVSALILLLLSNGEYFTRFWLPLLKCWRLKHLKIQIIHLVPKCCFYWFFYWKKERFCEIFKTVSVYALESQILEGFWSWFIYLLKNYSDCIVVALHKLEGKFEYEQQINRFTSSLYFIFIWASESGLLLN